MPDGKTQPVEQNIDLHWRSLAETALALRCGEISALSLTETMLNRINALNGQLHCYSQVLEDAALERAESLDAKRLRGETLGPLHGVPIGLKDLLNTKGVVTASGTKVMANYVPTSDATVVRRLEEAGTVVLGKLQLTEGAYGSHHPELQSPVNPWGRGLWPGVSSSGSGVSVAAGLAFASLGSDTGGSIRFPSVANGVVGIKPTYGRVSRSGAFPLGESLDHIGPLARSVEDAAMVLQAIAGHDGDDPNSLDVAVADFSADLSKGIAGMRLGIDWSYVEAGVAPPVAQMMRDVVVLLRSLGAEVIEVELPADYKTLVRNWVVTCGVECALAHQGMYPEQKELYGPDLTGLIELGHKVGGLQYTAMERIRERFRRQLDGMFGAVDGFLCPALPVSLPTLDEMASSAEISEERAEFITFTAPFNYSGHPTISLPLGLDDTGRPLGFQIVGPWLGEAQLIRFGRAIEQAVNFLEHPKL